MNVCTKTVVGMWCWGYMTTMIALIEKWPAVKQQCKMAWLNTRSRKWKISQVVFPQRGKTEAEREKNGATINSILVMRGEKATEGGWDERVRVKNRCRECRPKLCVYLILKQLRSENDQCMCSDSMDILMKAKITTYTRVNLVSFNGQITSTKAKHIGKTKRGTHLPAVE